MRASAEPGARKMEPELEQCRAWIAYPASGPLERCVVELLRGDAVVVVSAVTECGGDSCGVRAFAWSDAARTFTELPGDVGGVIAASPLGDFVVVDTPTSVLLAGADGTEARDPFGGTSELVIERISLPGLERTAFAPCFSPVLSPSGRSFLCRDRSANVLAVPTTGATPRQVASSGVGPAEVDWALHAYAYPEPVEFPAPDRVRFRVISPEGVETFHEVPYRD